MNRRDFLGSCTAALTAAALGGLGRCPALGAEPPATPRDLPDQSDKAPALPVALLRCESYEPKLLLAGRNGVCTDAVATAVMGFDPEAPHGQKPFPGDICDCWHRREWAPLTSSASKCAA